MHGDFIWMRWMNHFTAGLLLLYKKTTVGRSKPACDICAKRHIGLEIKILIKKIFNDQ